MSHNCFYLFLKSPLFCQSEIRCISWCSSLAYKSGWNK